MTSIAAPLIKDEMGLSATGYGLVVAAFFWTYVPVLVLAGSSPREGLAA